jgi:hypothetical protein
MNSNVSRRQDGFIRIDGFGTESAADFRPGSKGNLLFTSLKTVIANINQFGTGQVSAKGDARRGYQGKGTARENVREIITQMANTVAGGIAYEIPGLDAKFRIPADLPDDEMLALARSFSVDAQPLEAKFIEWGMEDDFLVRLNEAIEAFEQSLGATNTALGEQVESTADIGEQVRRGMIIRRQLNVVVRNRYKDDPGKLAAWQSAQHIAHPKRKKKETGENPPQG